MGEAFAGKTVGKKAMIWGALAQSIPDIDFLAAFWTNTSDNLLAHRGFTHSILFGLVISFVMASLAERWHRPHNISLHRWIYFFGAVILTHIFIDAFNNYGVAWFEPFSHYRISFNTIYVADPFFSIGPAIAILMLLLLKQRDKTKKWNIKRRSWWRFGLILPFFYLGYCLINKVIINRDVKQVLARQEIKYTRYFTTPAPLQDWLWYVVAGDDKGYYVGYRSVFDHSASPMHLEYFPRNNFLIDSLCKQDIRQLIRFSQQYYTIEKKHDTLIFNDLRFGQIVGWHDPKEGFAFHYYLEPVIDNTLVVQRGRFAKWNKHTMRSFIRRIKGN